MLVEVAKFKASVPLNGPPARYEGSDKQFDLREG